MRFSWFTCCSPRSASSWNWLSGSAGSPHPLPSFLIMAFLTWRVSRGGWFARRILILASFASGAVAAVDVARRWDLTIVALVIIGAAQVALLVSPPVYGRTRRPTDSGPGARLGAAGATAAGLAAAVGAARGSAGDARVPGEHGLGRGSRVQAGRIRARAPPSPRATRCAG